MPRGVSKRGIPGISVLYTTWPEARFDGATGTVIGIDPRSTYGIPLYLVDFSQHKNRVAIPWQRQWFRGEWIVPAGGPRTETGRHGRRARGGVRRRRKTTTEEST